MKSTKIYLMIMLIALLTSCDMKCSVGGTKEAKTVTSSDNSALNGATIKNDIELEATGVKLKEAYVVDEANNVLTENATKVGEKIYLVIKLDTGWVKENGKSFLGASERISTSAGSVVVNADDIFKDYEITGVDAADAKVITLSALITEAKAGVEDFVVQFRVWDKKGSGEVKGKYKFKIKS
ncbi:MAG: hypothetical protein ABIO79_05395 [Ferruginibacter sp.]